jgi:putative transposase
MTIRTVPLVDNEYYHIYSRGNSKQEIFLDKKDYEHFIKCLFVFNTHKNFKFRNNVSRLQLDPFDFERGELLVSIGSWVLMPNHFHIYIRTNPHKSDLCKEDKNRISEFMRKVLTSYAKYFNLKYKRTGGLFEGKFKSVHINNDNQAKYLFSYIHLNPIKLIQKDWKELGLKDTEKALEFLRSYKWSSYLDHKDYKRKENSILNSEHFPKYFFNTKDFDKEILSWLEHKTENIF